MRLDDDLKYFETQEFKDILAKYEAARQAGSSVYMDADELTDVAEYYAMVQNDEELAGEAIDLALQLHPEAVDPLIFQARQYMLKGDEDAARQACDAIPDQQHREVYFLRAELMVREGKSTQAREYLLNRSEDVTEDLDYFIYDSAYIFIDYHDDESARLFAEKLEQIAPKWFKTWELMADVCLSYEKNADALKYIEMMLDKDPFYLTAWNWRAEAYCGLLDYTKAFESTEYALAVEPQNERAMELKAWILMRQENPEEAHKIYEQLRRMNPESEMHCLYDSYCLFDLQRIDDSLQLIKEAERLAGGMSQEQAAIYEHHAHILSEKSLVEDALHYIDLAEDAIEDAAVIHNQQPDTYQDFDYYRARILAENGDSETALQYIERIAQKEREPIASIIMRGAQILFEAGDYGTSLELFQMILRQDLEEEKKARLYPYIAACLHEQGNKALCLDYIRLAIDNNSPDMKEILGYLFAEGVQPAEYYDYYYYQLNNRWPKSDV